MRSRGIGSGVRGAGDGLRRRGRPDDEGSTTADTGLRSRPGTSSDTTAGTTEIPGPTTGDVSIGSSDATGVTTFASTGTSETGVPSTSTTGSTTEFTTGEVLPGVHTLRITDANRHYVEMHGGWGPHLRGLMRATDDALWFTADKGEDVLHNREILYFRRGADEPAWTAVGAQMQLGGIQQNVASVLIGDVIYSYGVDIAAHLLEECTWSVVDPAAHACNAVLISGAPYMTPASSNYVGAAVLGDGWRIVWWTVVGENGDPGAFYYTYNYGGGWNGPVVTDLAPYNDIGYVHAMSTLDGRLMLAGQTFTGKYPDGTYNAVVADVTPGMPVAFSELASGSPDLAAQTAADLWIDRASEAVHVVATTGDGAVRYYHRPGGAAWADHVQPLHVFPDSYRARFMRAGDGPLHLVRGSAGGSGVEVLRAATSAVAEAVDWAAAESFAVVPPGEGFAAPSALFVESPTYQTAPVAAVQFAMCGQYQVSDGEVWQGVLE
jgi:hypothetical protein